MAVSKETLAELKAFHQHTLDKVGAPNGPFFPKCLFTPKGKDYSEKYIALWPSEISKGLDLYFEFCSAEGVPETPERYLYKWKFNQFYEEEYEKLEPYNGTGHRRYLIPLEELVIVEEKPRKGPMTQPSNETKTELKAPDTDIDLPFDQMTIRDFAAIMTKKPVSKKEWLNKLIKSK